MSCKIQKKLTVIKNYQVKKLKNSVKTVQRAPLILE